MRRRVLVVAVLAAVTGALAAAPRPLSSPIARLANYRPDSADPIYDTQIDAAALRRAAALIPDHSTYAIWDDPQDGLLDNNLRGAAALLFTPALPVAEPARARWILSYDAPRLVPTGVPVSAVIRLGTRIALIEVRG